MYKKIFGIFFCTLLIFSGFATANLNIDESNQILEEEKIANRVFVFGIMENMDYQPTHADYEIIGFTFIFDSGQFEFFNVGEMIRLYANIFVIDLGNLVVGFCEDWSIIG